MDNTNDKVEKVKQPTGNALHDEFLSLHLKGQQKSQHDATACDTAKQTDINTLNLLQDPLKNKDALLKLLGEDMKQDKQAAGANGDDRKNIALDNKMMQRDQEMLQKAGLSDEQRSALNNDIGLRAKDSGYSAQDIPSEKTYIDHDKALAKALQSGTGVDAAAKAVASDRKKDLAQEKIYSDNDKAMSASDEKLRKLFEK